MRPQSEPSEEFAPNAFSAPSRPPPPIRNQSTQYSNGPKWYDRIMDVVLGEDETQAKNRMALICESCRLVNGQAPPGARTPEDVGRWRCSSCHAWNGVDSEEKRMLKRIKGEPLSPTTPTSATSDAHLGISSEDEHVDEDVGDDDEDAGSGPSGSTRSKARQREKA